MAGRLGVLLMAFSLLVAGPPATAQEKAVTPDLKALADGKGGTIPAEATLKWVEDAKGRAPREQLLRLGLPGRGRPDPPRGLFSAVQLPGPGSGAKGSRGPVHLPP